MRKSLTCVRALVSEDWNFSTRSMRFLNGIDSSALSDRSVFLGSRCTLPTPNGHSFRAARQLRRQHFHLREEPNSHSRLDRTSEASLAFLENRTFRSATTGKSSRGAFGFVMPFPQQSTWPASGPSQRPRGPVRIFTNTQARGSVLRHSGAWSLVQAMLSWFLK